MLSATKNPDRYLSQERFDDIVSLNSAEDPGFAKLLFTEFARNATETVAEIAQEVQADHTSDSIPPLLHRLVGISSNSAADPLAEYAERLETQCQQGNWIKTSEFDDLAKLLEATLTELELKLKEQGLV